MIDPEELTVETKSGGRLDLVLRTLRAEDYAQCEALQRHTWGQDFNEVVPPSMMMISQKLGGVLAGAFDTDDRLVAFVFGQTGVRRGRFFHWSHMLATRSELRGAGLGRHLKLFQRRFLLALGVDEVEWTYDPLESRNAHLNLNRLGAEPVRYLRDVYDGSTSTLHSGIGTDRFMVLWKLTDPEVEARIDGHCPPGGIKGGRHCAGVEKGHDAPVVNADGDGKTKAPPFEIPDLPELRVEIPCDVQAVKERSMETAILWRSSTRHAFETGFERGYRVLRLDRDREAHRSFYVLLKR